MVQYFMQFHGKSPLLSNQMPLLVHFCNVDEDASRVPRAMHKHEDYAEFVYLTGGKGHHIIGGREYRTQKGDLLLFDPGVPHDERTDEDSPMRYFCVGIRNFRCQGLKENHIAGSKFCPVVHIGGNGVHIEAMLRLLPNLIFHPELEESVRYFTASLLTCVLHAVRAYGTPTDEGQNGAAQRVKQFIDGHYLKELTLDDIAEALHMSPFYLERTFKSAYGATPTQYIINRRIGEAQSMLIFSTRTVAEIAEASGYENANYFGSVFKKAVGITPARYRHFMRDGEWIHPSGAE